MKRYLMRGGMNPLKPLSPQEILDQDLIGGNTGNLMYAFGAYRILSTENVIIDVDAYGVERRYKDKDIDEINEKYDGYICPLANAFRETFQKKLNWFIWFISKLKIPVFIIGMGVQTPYEPDFNNSHSYDEDVIRFMNVVLNKTNIVGLRGEYTAEYLKKLGGILKENISRLLDVLLCIHLEET